MDMENHQLQALAGGILWCPLHDASIWNPGENLEMDLKEISISTKLSQKALNVLVFLFPRLPNATTKDIQPQPLQPNLIGFALSLPPCPFSKLKLRSAGSNKGQKTPRELLLG